MVRSVFMISDVGESGAAMSMTIEGLAGDALRAAWLLSLFNCRVVEIRDAKHKGCVRMSAVSGAEYDAEQNTGTDPSGMRDASQIFNQRSRRGLGILYGSDVICELGSGEPEDGPVDLHKENDAEWTQAQRDVCDALFSSIAADFPIYLDGSFMRYRWNEIDEELSDDPQDNHQSNYRG